MNEVRFTLLYYLVIFTLIIIGGLISPTDLAGPGLDMLIILIAVICSVVLLIRNLLKVKAGKAFIISGAIHFIVNAIIVLAFIFGH